MKDRSDLLVEVRDLLALAQASRYDSELVTVPRREARLCLLHLNAELQNRGRT